MSVIEYGNEMDIFNIKQTHKGHDFDIGSRRFPPPPEGTYWYSTRGEEAEHLEPMSVLCIIIIIITTTTTTTIISDFMLSFFHHPV
jgi:hypothetical protein